MSRRRSFRASAKFYVILGILAACLAGGWFLFQRRETISIEPGTIDFSASMAAVVVRDEDVIASESYGMASYLVPDQQRVEADTPVVNIYKWGYNDKVMSDLVDVRTRILQYETTLLGSDTSGLTQLNKDIADITAQIRLLSSAEDAQVLADAAQLESRLTSLMNEREQLLRDRVTEDQQLEDYRKQEQQLEERVNSWRDVWSSPDAGVVSYYFDGYEPVVNADNIRDASVSQIRAILAGTLPPAQMAEGTEPLYRLVNNFQWYILIPSHEQVLEFANDNVFTAVFDEYPDRQFEGTVIGHIAEGGDHLYVMEFNEDIGSLVNTRRAQVQLSATFSGYKIPAQSVRTQDGTTGVYVVEERARVFVPVTVTAEEDGEAIILPVNNASPLQGGTRISR